MSKNFHIEPVVVTLNVLFFAILNPIFVFPVNWVLDRFGMRVGCSLGGILTVAGVWLRTLLADGEVGWCLCGTILASIGSIFILSSPSIIANNWFKPSSVPPAISLAVLATLLSVAFGSSLPGLIIKQAKDDSS